MKIFNKYKETCQKHWKEILVLAMSFHFLMDWVIFILGALVGYHLNEGHCH